MEEPEYVVLDEHTLGYIIGNSIQVLHASIIRSQNDLVERYLAILPRLGCPFTGEIDRNRVRTATLEDFKTYRVSPPPHLRKLETPCIKATT